MSPIYAKTSRGKCKIIIPWGEKALGTVISIKKDGGFVVPFVERGRSAAKARDEIFLVSKQFCIRTSTFL